MGNNYCKAVGIVPGHPIHLSQFDNLWKQFDAKNRGYLSQAEAVNFLREFAKATDTKYTSNKASTIVDDLLGPDGNMGKLAFEKLFLAMAMEQKIMMSQSLLEELEFADGAAHSGIETCRKGHSLQAVVPYNGTGWICDLCRLPGSGPSNHCSSCGFDLCDRCKSGPKPHVSELERTCMLPFLQTLQLKCKPVPIETLVGAHRPEVPAAVSAVVSMKSSSTVPVPATRVMTEADAKLVAPFAEVVSGNYQVDTVGGKALKLSQVAAAFQNSPIFSVPAGAAVTTRAYSRHIAQLDAKLVQAVWAEGDISLLEPLRHAIEERSIDSDTRNAIAVFLKTLPADATLAVRSSATAEDAADFSMAGLAETYLHIPNDVEQVCKHVRKCWSSLWQERVVSYISRAAHGKAPVPRMCVVLQQMVNAAAAGVLFTLHPNNGNEERMFIEAVHGLGEGVVSGDINPSSYDCSWVTRQYAVKHTPQKKKYARTPGSFGSSVIPTTDTEQNNPPLSRAAVERLLQLGVSVASHYGAPQDIEWAVDGEGRLFMTQTRPITEYSLNIDAGDDTWYPGFQEKTWLCVSMATVTGFSSVVRSFAPKFKSDVVRLYYGQAYASSHAEGVFQASLRSVQVARSLAYRAKQTMCYCKHFQNQIEPTLWGLVGNLSSLSDSELYQLVRLMLPEMTETDYHSFLSGSLASNYLHTVQGWLKTLSLRDSSTPSIDALITGAHPNTGGAARMIREIAHAASQHPDAREFVLKTPASEFVTKLAQRKDLEWLWADVSKFLRSYFWMCDIDEEIDSSHWLDDPTLPVESLKAELAKNSYQILESGADAWAKTLASLQRIVPPVLGAEHAERFFSDLFSLRTWLQCKEEVHETYGRCNYFAQKILLELGQRWTAAKHLRHAREIFDLGQNDILECLDSSDMRQYLREKQLYHHQSLRAMFRKFKAPTLIQPGARKLGRSQTSSSYDDEDSSNLRGRAGARGRATARARVIMSLDEANQVLPGEILVTQQTSPGWTPLFARIAGLVTEQGGILSHGAVVARECKIPAVLQVDNATKLIKTGQMLTIDGDSGEVTIE